jgi:hypothetical protein
VTRYKLGVHVRFGLIYCSGHSRRRRDRLSSLFADAHRQWRGLYRASPFGRQFRLAWLAIGPDHAQRSRRCRSPAYYIPVVDNLLDTLATPAAFVAGTIVSAAVMTDAPPMVKWTAAVVAGGVVAGLTQGMTGILRAHSTLLTGGLGNSIIATAELGGAVLISFLALAAPTAAIALVVLFLLVAIRLLRRRFRKEKSSDGGT